MAKNDPENETQHKREILPPAKVPKVWSSVRRPRRPLHLSPIFEDEPTELPPLTEEFQKLLDANSTPK